MKLTHLGSVQVLYTRFLLLFLILLLGFTPDQAHAVRRIKLIAEEPQALSVHLTWQWRGAKISSVEKLDIQWSNCSSAFTPLITFANPTRIGTVVVTVPSTGSYCFRARALRAGRLIARTRMLQIDLDSTDLGDDFIPPDPTPIGGDLNNPPPTPGGSGWLVTPTTELPATISECPAGFEEAALAEVNRGRVSASMPELIYSRDLWIAARMHSSAMALSGVLTHDGWDRFFVRTAFGWIAQNIAVYVMDGASLGRAWLDSPPHRASILDPRAHFSGIACVVDSNGGIWSTQYLAIASSPAG